MAIDFSGVASRIYDDFVAKYTEAFKYLFSGAVQTTPEIGLGEATSDSFCEIYGHKDANKFPFTGEVFREVERTSASLFWGLAFSQDGYSADEVYTLIAEKQHASADVLTRKNFDKLMQRFSVIKENPNFYQALHAMLIYSDVGKSQKVKDIAHAYELQFPDDHDDFISTLLKEKKADIAKVLPSIEKISPSVLLIMQNIASSMQVHQGHIKHLEGGARQLLAKFEHACQQGKVTKEALDIAFAIQLCDVTASSAQTDPLSCALTESSYQAYHLVYQLLDSIRKGKSLNAAYKAYYKNIAVQFQMIPRTDVEFIAIRIGQLTRASSTEEIEEFLMAIDALDADDQDALIAMMKPGGTYDGLPRNPSFFNGLLLNAKTKHNSADAIVKGLLYQVRVLEKITAQPLSADKVLCFQPLAAESRSSDFFLEPFDSEMIELDDRFNVCLKKPEIHLQNKIS